MVNLKFESITYHLRENIKTPESSMWYPNKHLVAIAFDVCDCDVNNGSRGMKGAGNGNLRLETPNLHKNYVEKPELFQYQVSKLSQNSTEKPIMSYQSADRLSAT